MWMGVSAYPISPTTLTAGAQYTGFQTRPRTAAGTYNVADAAHPTHRRLRAVPRQHQRLHRRRQAGQPHSRQCERDLQRLPHRHRLLGACRRWRRSTPTRRARRATARSATDRRRHRSPFRPPTSASSGCRATTCRPAPRARPATSARARRSRALPVGNGAKFSGSLMSHAGITNNCSACHTPAGANAAFAGISAIVGMPATSPMGSSAHIPSGTTCETCHLASLPTGLIAASADQDRARHGFRDPGARQRADPHRHHLGLHELPRGQLCVDGRERLPDLAVGADRRRTVHRLPDAATHRGRHLQRRRRRAPDAPATARSATATPAPSPASTSRPTTSRTARARPATPATPAPTTR